VYLTLTLIDSLEIFQAYGNTADLHDDWVNLFKHMRGVVNLKEELGIRYIITPEGSKLFEYIIGYWTVILLRFFHLQSLIPFAKLISHAIVYWRKHGRKEKSMSLCDPYSLACGEKNNFCEQQELRFKKRLYKKGAEQEKYIP
jgi:hypothetical protein